MASAETSQRAVYLIEFEAQGVLERGGGSTAKRWVQSASGKRALAAVEEEQGDLIEAVAQRLARALAVRQRYHYAFNGISTLLSEAEAQRVRGTPGVRAVRRDFVRTTQTDASPGFVGADQVWASQPIAAGSTGQGVVVGVIDSGIAPQHPAFAAVDATGYRHSNPRGRRFGLCLTTQAARCNDKLIGIYDFTDEAARDGIDLDGHGTHTASTAAGGYYDAVQEAPTTRINLRLSGVAPHANIISYKTCVRGSAGNRASCRGEWLVAALDRAIADGVDVINYSIGGNPSDSWALLDVVSDERSMFNARAAGIVVAVAAGNSGPVSGSVASPANAPWVIGVASLSTDRSFQTVLDQLSGSNPPPKSSFTGPSVSAATSGPLAITLGERFGSALCSRGTDADFPPTGASNPFANNTFSGQIVLCQRGVQARVAKSRNLSLSGAGGMILVNTSLEGESTVADGHFVPSIHLGLSDGEQLLAWLRATPDARGRISASTKVRDPRLGDVLAVSSARGPVQSGVLKPDLAAPGVNILAADAQGTGARALSGTSMAAPHVAGAAALLRALRPNWGVDVIHSVLVTSSLSASVRLEDAVSTAPPLARGGGRLQIQRALASSLFFPLSSAQLRAGNPRQGGQPIQLNLPSVFHPSCFAECQLVRRVQALRAGTWRSEVTTPTGLRLDVTPPSFSLAQGDTQTLTIRASITSPDVLATTLNAEWRLIAQDGSGDVLRMPVSIVADPGNLPKQLDVPVNADRGLVRLDFNGVAALPGARSELLGYADREEALSLTADTNDPNDAFADSSGTATRFFSLQLGEALLANVDGAGDLDLYLGRDLNGNSQAEAEEQICSANGPSGIEYCVLEATQPGNHWLLVHNPSTTARSARLLAGVAGTRVDTGATMPARLKAQTPFAIQLRYELAGLVPGARSLGLLRIFPSFDGARPLPPTLLVFQRGSAVDEAPKLLSHGSQRQALQPGQAWQRAFVDVAAGQLVQLQVSGAPQVSWQWLSLPFAAPSSEAAIAAAPEAPVLASGSADMGVPTSIPSVSSGRRYLRLRNQGSVPAVVDIRLVASDVAGAVPATGAYFNPARSGHGIFLTRSGARGQLVWYSYDAQGLPVFYLGFDDRMFDGTRVQHRLALSRFTDDGRRALGAPVGEVLITVQSAERLQFSWNVLGRSGSEAMQWLGGGGCVPELATGTLSGLWFQPERSGYGASTLVQADQDLFVTYLYDGLGEPRWLLGSGRSPGQGSIVLEQYTGFCPECAFVPVQREAVGSLQRRFPSVPAGSAGGEWSIDVGFARGLPQDRWLSTGRMVLLTETQACR